VSLHKRAFKRLIIYYLLGLDRVINAVLFVFLESRVVSSNVVKQFTLLLKQVHFHPLGKHVVTFLDDLVLCLRLGKQALKEVVLLLRCVLFDDVLRKTQLFLLRRLLLRLVNLQEWIVEQSGVFGPSGIANVPIITVKSAVRVVRFHFVILLFVFQHFQLVSDLLTGCLANHG